MITTRIGSELHITGASAGAELVILAIFLVTIALTKSWRERKAPASTKNR